MTPTDPHAGGADRAAPLRAVLDAVEGLARTGGAALATHQALRLAALHRHHAAASAWWRKRLQQAGLDPAEALTPAALSRLAPITRADLQARGPAAFVPAPAGHGAVSLTQTSGSSGEPVKVARTGLSHLYWMAYSVREHLWWQRDVSLPLFVVRANLGRDFITQPDWGPPMSLLQPTGPGHAASVELSTLQIAELMRALKPAYVLLYPSVLRGVLGHFRAWGERAPGLRQVRTMGETLDAELRQDTQAVLGVDIADTYSSQEVGVIAMQCLRGDGYHLMAENLLVEVLRPDGSPCAPGESGEVVVTDLHNYATPLLRYAIGDWAEAGGRCGCGCRLPMIAAVRGRRRNLIAYPDGSRRWPRVGFARFREVAPIRQYQVVQHALDDIELRLVCPPLTAEQQAALQNIVMQALGHAFPVRITHAPDGLARRPNGKHEEVISHLA